MIFFFQLSIAVNTITVYQRDDTRGNRENNLVNVKAGVRTSRNSSRPGIQDFLKTTWWARACSTLLESTRSPGPSAHDGYTDSARCTFRSARFFLLIYLDGKISPRRADPVRLRATRVLEPGTSRISSWTRISRALDF